MCDNYLYDLYVLSIHMKIACWLSLIASFNFDAHTSLLLLSSFHSFVSLERIENGADEWNPVIIITQFNTIIRDEIVLIKPFIRICLRHYKIFIKYELPLIFNYTMRQFDVFQFFFFSGASCHFEFIESIHLPVGTKNYNNDEKMEEKTLLYHRLTIVWNDGHTYKTTVFLPLLISL